LIIQILRGRKIGQYAQHSQAIFLRGGEVGGEQWATHNLAILVIFNLKGEPRCRHGMYS
jgi:hypothetical protein